MRVLVLVQVVGCLVLVLLVGGMNKLKMGAKEEEKSRADLLVLPAQAVFYRNTTSTRHHQFHSLNLAWSPGWTSTSTSLNSPPDGAGASVRLRLARQCPARLTPFLRSTSPFNDGSWFSQTVSLLYTLRSESCGDLFFS